MYERVPEQHRDYDYQQNRPNDLRPLGDMGDWHVAEGEPDIRGWDVVDTNGNKVGTADDLMFSESAGAAIMALVSHGGFLGMGGEKTLVPIDRLDLDMDNDQAVFNGSQDDLKNAPRYRDQSRDFGPFYDYWSGRRMPEGHEMPEGREMRGETRVIPEIEERLEVGKRAEQVGEVTIHKEVETHPETARATVKRTTVHVLRRDVGPGREVRPGEQVLREGETVTIPVVEEKLVAEVKLEVVGEVVITPETETREEEVTREVRREHVEVEASGEAEVEEEEEDRTHRM